VARASGSFAGEWLRRPWLQRPWWRCSGALDCCAEFSRRFAWAEYHKDVFLFSKKTIETEGLTTEVEGGGRIEHSAARKAILVYGYSMAYGRAEHSHSAELLKKAFGAYPEKNITWTNEGY
jgi:phosphohistidine phosphatase